MISNQQELNHSDKTPALPEVHLLTLKLPPFHPLQLPDTDDVPQGFHLRQGYGGQDGGQVRGQAVSGSYVG
jgi:hypothetical protein